MHLRSHPAWLGPTPSHPDFSNGEAIRSNGWSFKSNMLLNALRGCEKLIDELAPSNGDLAMSLMQSLTKNLDLWIAVLGVYRYNGIYLLSRLEARCLSTYASENAEEVDKVESFLSTQARAIRAINYGVHRFEVEFQRENARNRDNPSEGVDDREADQILQDRRPRYDIGHTLSRITAAKLNPPLYYNDGASLRALREALPNTAKLVLKKHMGSHQTNIQFLRDCFDTDYRSHFPEHGLPEYTLRTRSLNDKVTDQAEKRIWTARIEEKLATVMTNYYLGKLTLHPRSGIKLPAPRTFKLRHLAALAQTLAYEAPAAEMEQQLFTRVSRDGCGDGQVRGGNARERIQALARSRELTYDEMRTVYVHRALRTAYAMVIEHMLREVPAWARDVPKDLREVASTSATETIKVVRDFLYYADWRRVGRRDLWRVILDDRFGLVMLNPEGRRKRAHKGFLLDDLLG